MQRPQIRGDRSFLPNRSLAEIFISNAKAGSHSDSAAKDFAVVCSIALQYGVPLELDPARAAAGFTRRGVVSARGRPRHAGGVMTGTIIDAALHYAARGLQVFPVPPDAKKSYKWAARSNGRAWA